MKKIIYIFLLGLVFVACDKNEIAPEALTTAELQLVSPVKSAQGINDAKTNKIIDWLIANLENTDGAKLGNAANSSKGADYIAVDLFLSEDITYLVVSDETNDDLCFGDQTTTRLFYDNSAGDGSVLTVEDSNETVIRSINGNFAGFFGLGQNSITKLTFDAGDLIIGESVNFSESNVANFSAE